MQTPTPPSMKPGAVSTEGPGLASGAFGTRVPGADLAPVVPADQGANVFNASGSMMVKTVEFYNGAAPPPVGGGGNPARSVRKA